jgi:hypothetical protein
MTDLVESRGATDAHEVRIVPAGQGRASPLLSNPQSRKAHIAICKRRSAAPEPLFLIFFYLRCTFPCTHMHSIWLWPPKIIRLCSCRLSRGGICLFASELSGLVSLEYVRIFRRLSAAHIIIIRDNNGSARRTATSSNRGNDSSWLTGAKGND